jgi:hypothetical protein
MRAVRDRSSPPLEGEVRASLEGLFVFKAAGCAYVRIDWDNPEKVECANIFHRRTDGN